MNSSLANRLRATPFLIEETDGLFVVEPLQFIPIADGTPFAGSVGACRDNPHVPAGVEIINIKET